MELKKSILRDWEHRIPDLYGSWTHWKVVGDQDTIGVIEGNRLLEVIALLQTSYGKYPKIKVVRAKSDEQGTITDEEVRHDTIIYIYEDVEWELGHRPARKI